MSKKKSKFDTILFPPDVVEKVLFKHGVRPVEIEMVLLEEVVKTYIEKVSKERFMAIGKCHRGFLTIIFDMEVKRVAEIVSARFSSDSEKRKYKRKM